MFHGNNEQLIQQLLVMILVTNRLLSKGKFQDSCIFCLRVFPQSLTRKIAGKVPPLQRNFYHKTMIASLIANRLWSLTLNRMAVIQLPLKPPILEYRPIVRFLVDHVNAS